MKARLLLVATLVITLMSVVFLGRRNAQAFLPGPADEVMAEAVVQEAEVLQTLAHGRVIPGDSAKANQLQTPESESPVKPPLPGEDALDKRALTGDIAFSSDRNGTGVYDLFVQDVVTGEVAGIVTGSGNDATPVWSPDGHQLLFASNRDGDFDIYLRTEGQEINLTANTAEDIHPSWSPDGQHVLFSSNREGGYFQVYTMDLDGQNGSQVGVVPDNNALFPRYSPDGSRIAFMRASILLPACDWNWDIWLMDANGQNQRRLTTRLGGDLYPAWTPDGDVIYAGCGNLLDSDLYVIDPDTGVDNKLLGGFWSNEWAATYSPDADYIAYNSDTDGNSEIYIATSGGVVIKNFTQNPAEDLLPSWTGDFTPPPPPPNPDRELAERFAPVMYFHIEENYRPITVTIPLSKAELPCDQSGQEPNLEMLMTAECNKHDTYIDFDGEGRAGTLKSYQNKILPEIEKPLVFARVKHDDESGQTAIQYWFFYYDNPWKNHHEGDWEMIQVVVDSYEDPVYGVYAQHFGGSKRWWQDMDVVTEIVGDVTYHHPIVYVARHSHASYFKPYDYFQGFDIPLLPFGTDSAVVSTTTKITPTVMLLPQSSMLWPHFQGHWGAEGPMPCVLGIDGDDGPRGPVWSTSLGDCSQIDYKKQWNDPFGWASERTWDEAGIHNGIIKFRVGLPSPLDVHVYEKGTGNHVGWNAGDIDEEIPGSEYFDNQASNWRTIILHQVDPLDPSYEVKITWRSLLLQAAKTSAVESYTVNLEFPDMVANKAISATYTISQTWLTTTTGTILVNPDSDLLISLDLNGDGVTDEEVAPESLEEIPVDLTPPAAVDDLEVIGTDPGQVTLRWTAPGDDEHTGQADFYEMRYYWAPITSTNWVSATSVIDLPEPALAGTQQQITVTGVPAGTHYFAIRAVDNVFLHGPLSNNAAAQVPARIYLPVIHR